MHGFQFVGNSSYEIWFHSDSSFKNSKQNRKILPWARNSKQKLIFRNNGSPCFQYKAYSARPWQLPTCLNIPLGCCPAPCQLSGSSCKVLPGFRVPEHPHHVRRFGQASRSPNESAYEPAYWGPRLVLGATSENPRNVALGRQLGGIVLEDQQGTGSKTEQGLTVPRCAGRDKDIPELHLRPRWKWGSRGLQTPNSTTPTLCWAAWEAQLHVLQDIQLRMPESRLIFFAALGKRVQHFLEIKCFPLPKPGLACSPPIEEGQLLRHP